MGAVRQFKQAKTKIVQLIKTPMAEFCDLMFLMYGDQQEQVILRCRCEILNRIIDKRAKAD